MCSFAVLQHRYDVAANAIKSIKNYSAPRCRYHIASITESAARVRQFCEDAEHLIDKLRQVMVLLDWTKRLTNFQNRVLRLCVPLVPTRIYC